jgi:hypothetical protein
MVSVVDPVLLEPLFPLSLLLLPQAATPKASAVTKQPEAATDRARKSVPPQRPIPKWRRFYA